MKILLRKQVLGKHQKKKKTHETEIETNKRNHTAWKSLFRNIPNAETLATNGCIASNNKSFISIASLLIATWKNFKHKYRKNQKKN